MRADFRIIGNLVGNSSSKQQSNHFGLPALLLPEEITLLKEKQFARLLTSPHSNTSGDSNKLFETAGRNSSETMVVKFPVFCVSEFLVFCILKR